MKRLLIFVFLFICAFAKGQVYQLMPQYGYDAKRMKFDSTLQIPTFCGTPSLRSNILNKSAIAYDSCNKRFYYYDPKLAVWDTIKGGGGASIDTTSLSNRINAKADTSALALKLNRSDSTLYYTKYRSDTSRSNIYASMALKMAYSDTVSLSNRINGKIDSLKRSTDSVFFKKNGTWFYAFKDSTGTTNGFVPYTGATQDVDLGVHSLNARNVKVTGTAGNGHLDLKHQSADVVGQGNSSMLYANSQGYLKWKNDNLYYSTLAMPQTADRVYTYQNKSYTLGDSADIAARVKYTDTATMLTVYLRKADTSSLSNRINAKPNLNATSTYIPYREGSNFRDSYLVNDTTNEVLKSVYGGNDIGLKLDFANDQYLFGDYDAITNGTRINILNDINQIALQAGINYSQTSLIIDDNNQSIKSTYTGNDIGLKLDFANNLFGLGAQSGTYNSGIGFIVDYINGKFAIGDLPGTQNEVFLEVDAANNYIKSISQGNDIGLKLDFANSDYNIGTATKNFQVKNDSLKINGLIGQSGDSVINITNTGKLGKVSIAGKLNTSDSSIYQSKFRSDTARTNIYSAIAARLRISDTASMLTNYQRTSSFPVATFGAGSGASGDTSAFSTTALYGSFYLNGGADTIIVTGYTGIVQGTSASVTPTIWFNDSLNVTAGATKIVNSPSAVTSTTTGNTVTSLDNTKIPPGNFIWVTTGTVTTKPTYFNLTLIGYRKR